MDDRDRDMLLISLVQQHRHIFDKNSTYFKDKTAVETSWKIIALAMKTTEDDCQRRWCVLRNRYAKERREQNRPDSQKKNWPLMVSMSFLDEHVRRRRSYRCLSDMQELIMERPNLNGRLIMSKPEKWEEIIIDEDDDPVDQGHEVKHVLSDADHSNASSYFVDEDITIYKQPMPKPPEMQPAPKIVSSTTLENNYKTDVEMSSSIVEKAVEIEVPLNNKDIIEHINTPTSDDSNMHFCLSLQESMQKIPKKFLTKAKIEILQVLEKYEYAT